MYALRLCSQDELLKIIEDNLRNWSTEEFDSNIEDTVTIEDRFESNKKQIQNLISDMTGE